MGSCLQNIPYSSLSTTFICEDEALPLIGLLAATRKKEAQLQKDLYTGNEVKVAAEGPVYYHVSLVKNRPASIGHQQVLHIGSTLRFWRSSRSLKWVVG